MYDPPADEGPPIVIVEAPDPEPPESRCMNCGAAHHIQRCSEVRAVLFAPDALPVRRHPFTPPPIGLEYARILCHRLARTVAGAAHVVDDRGHLIVALDEQIDAGWWPREAIVYSADCAHIAAL